MASDSKTRELEVIKRIFTTRLWLVFGLVPMLVLIVIILWMFSILPANESFGINKTVGWAWDLTGIGPFSGIVLSVFFFAFYGLISLFKIKTNFWLSVLHFATFLPMLIFPFTPEIVATAFLGSLFVFAVNLFGSIFGRFRRT